jgi:hypothetical protein
VQRERVATCGGVAPARGVPTPLYPSLLHSSSSSPSSFFIPLPPPLHPSSCLFLLPFILLHASSSSPSSFFIPPLCQADEREPVTTAFTLLLTEKAAAALLPNSDVRGRSLRGDSGAGQPAGHAFARLCSGGLADASASRVGGREGSVVRMGTRPCSEPLESVGLCRTPALTDCCRVRAVQYIRAAQTHFGLDRLTVHAPGRYVRGRPNAAWPKSGQAVAGERPSPLACVRQSASKPVPVLVAFRHSPSGVRMLEIASVEAAAARSCGAVAALRYYAERSVRAGGRGSTISHLVIQ